MELLQYGRRQYGLYQYGKYRKDSVRPDPGGEFADYKFGQARIKARINGEDTAWVIQHRPVQVAGRASLLRLTTNQKEQVYSQSIVMDGRAPRIRLTAGGKQIISEFN